MIRWFIVSLAIGLTACATGNIPTPPKFGDKDVRPVTYVWYNPDAGLYRASKWYRMNQDMTIPSRVIISNESACIVQTPEVNEPSIGDPYHCSTPWRNPR